LVEPEFVIVVVRVVGEDELEVGLEDGTPQGALLGRLIDFVVGKGPAVEEVVARE
jgi:hypothetical protein